MNPFMQMIHSMCEVIKPCFDSAFVLLEQQYKRSVLQQEQENNLAEVTLGFKVMLVHVTVVKVSVISMKQDFQRAESTLWFILYERSLLHVLHKEMYKKHKSCNSILATKQTKQDL